MSVNFSIRLDDSKKMFLCPKCGKKTLVKYVDYKTKKYTGGNANGACVRYDQCGYYSVPKVILSNYVVNKNESELRKMGYYTDGLGKIKLDYKKFNYSIPIHHLVDSMANRYDCTNFAKFLLKHIKNDAHFLLRKYYVGSDFENNPECNIFWKIDNNFIIRSGTVTLIDAQSGIIKKSTPISEELYDDIHCVSHSNCFFGSHLISLFPEKEIALVQDERIALICSYFWPEYNWLATGEIGNLSWLSYDVFNLFLNKKIIVFTDRGKNFFFDPIGLTYWQSIIDYISSEIPCQIVIGDFYQEKYYKLEQKKQDLFSKMMGLGFSY